MRGHITRRLLISAFVDPDEAATRLPAPLRPHVVDGGTVIGCCLLELASVRPDPLPAVVGQSLRAAAHRISVEWDSPEGIVVGVFVPIRHTDSRLAAAVGGRLVPGVHHRVPYETELDDDRLAHRVGVASSAHHMDVVVGLHPAGRADPAGELMSATCLAATVGLSPNRSGGLDAIGMRLAHHDVGPVSIERLESPFVSSFASAGEPIGRLLSSADVRWERAWSPTA